MSRRAVIGTSMLGVDGRIQRGGEASHPLAYKLFDMSDQLPSVGGRDAPLKFRQAAATSSPTAGRLTPATSRPTRWRARDIYLPDVHIDTIRPKTRDFRQIHA